MTNLTISLDEAVVRKARIRAIQEGTSVSAKVREFLSQYVQEEPTSKAGQGFLEFARRSLANSEAVTWARDDAYELPRPGR